MFVQVAHVTPLWSEKLRQRLDEMVNAQFDTPEFISLFSAPLTLASARWVATQMYFYTLNRRDCWAYVQARAPFDVKQSIWRHEEDELIHDERGGSDHITLMVKEAVALGMEPEAMDRSEPSPMVRSALYAWLHIATTSHWLASLTASHMLERRNNSAIVRGGGATKRWREKLVRELGIPAETLISSNVHLEADVEHSDIIWDTLARHITDETSYNTALEGARECMPIDRAFRGALAYGVREKASTRTT